MSITEATDQIIQERRSIYTNMFSGKQVDDAVIEKMIANARWAPTHKLTEPWQFVIFKGDGLQKLSEFQAELYRKKAERENTYTEEKYLKFKNKPLECSHVIAIGMKRNEVVPEVEEICAVACAVQNMWLTASAHRVGCYWSTGGVTFYDEAKPFFGLGENDRLLGFLYIGNVKSDKWPNGRRKSMEEKAKWIV